ncbi:hypothetical protein ES705_46396 [subsurface metagenome]
MDKTKKGFGESRIQKGGNNGRPVNPRPQVLRPKPPQSNPQKPNSPGGSKK